MTGFSGGRRAVDKQPARAIAVFNGRDGCFRSFIKFKNPGGLAVQVSKIPLNARPADACFESGGVIAADLIASADVT